MRSVLVSLIVLLLVPSSFSQMTFTDQWSKKSEPPFPRYKPLLSESTEHQNCEPEKLSQVLIQLARVNEIQNTLTSYLTTCYQKRT
ncbi:hypothetical protein RB195_001321 [Necator americanus]|uniref:Uncharacterized protein n=1 Tax=Necator americanus TaxID=51031 RepID=A0ABR1DE52_NECAM